MKCRVIDFSLLICLVWGGVAVAAAPAGQNADIETLLQKLQDEKSTNEAAEELIRRAQTDPETKKYLANHLPALLENYQENAPGRHGNFVWGNEAKVAGEFKIAETVPALCKRIDMMTNSGGGGSFGYNFINRGAVWSLILIGPPAVAAVADVLKDGTPLQRQEAAYVLGEIGTAPARKALTAAAKRESDPVVSVRIEEALKRPER